MALLPETLDADYESLPYTDTETESIIFHFAAKIDDHFLPFPLSESLEKQDFLKKAKELAKSIDDKFVGDVNTRLFKLKIMPPVKQDKALLKSIKRPVHIANFDVALMCVCKNKTISKKLEANEQFKELKNMFESSLSHNITVAKNIRKAGESHVHSQFTQGVYLFNYFYVEDTELDFLPVWEHTGNWFVENANLDNSYLLKPIDSKGQYQYINHCHWHGLSDFLPYLIFKRNLRKHVVNNFTHNRAIAFPIIYQIVT